MRERYPRRRVRDWVVGLAVLFTLVVLGFQAGCASGPRPDRPGSRPDSAPTSAKSGPTTDYRRGIAYLEQGNLDQAQSVVEALVASSPDRPELHNALGILYRRRGQMDRAIEEYQKAIRLFEKMPSGGLGSTSYGLYHNLAIAYREKGEFRKAEEAYRKSISLNENYAPSHYNLAVLYDLYLNQPADAVRFYRNYERLAGKNEMVEIWIADLEKRSLQGGGIVGEGSKN